jgi:uncharacterized protein (DUF1330 family)
MSSAYIIANVEVTNPTQYEEYKKWSTARHAGARRRSVRARRQDRSAGRRLERPQRIVMLKFPSVEKAKAFYDSPEYLPRRAKRARAPRSCA